MQDNKVSAASYILTFFRDVEELTNHLAQYSNIMLEMSGKFGKREPEDIIKKMTAEDRTRLLTVVNETRFWVIRVYVKISALETKIIKSDDKNLMKQITTNYEIVINNTVPEFKIIQDFVIELNKLFVSGVADELLNRARDFYDANQGANVEQ